MSSIAAGSSSPARGRIWSGAARADSASCARRRASTRAATEAGAAALSSDAEKAQIAELASWRIGKLENFGLRQLLPNPQLVKSQIRFKFSNSPSCGSEPVHDMAVTIDTRQRQNLPETPVFLIQPCGYVACSMNEKWIPPRQS